MLASNLKVLQNLRIVFTFYLYVDPDLCFWLEGIKFPRTGVFQILCKL